MGRQQKVQKMEREHFLLSCPIFRTSRMRKLLLAARYLVRMERERLLRRQTDQLIILIFWQTRAIS